jgi:uncharacterized membrane protein YozB (DUF420 family)
VDLGQLPHVNAALNGLAAVLLVAGRVAIARGRTAWHRRLMLTALVVSAAFLACYLVYHAEVGSVRFTARGPIRPVYFLVLASHVVLAALVPPLALVAVWHAGRGRFDRHRRVARIAWPVWLYVSASGVAVYLMLYHLFPPR